MCNGKTGPSAKPIKTLATNKKAKEVASPDINEQTENMVTVIMRYFFLLPVLSDKVPMV